MLNTKLNQIAVSSIYLVIPQGQNYVWSDEALINPDNYGYSNPEDIPVITTLVNIGDSSEYQHDFFITRSHFSQYGTLGVEFNREVDTLLSIVIGVVYIKK